MAVKIKTSDGNLQSVESYANNESSSKIPVNRKVITTPSEMIDACEIYDYMKTRVCIIESPRGKSTGLFLNNQGLLVTASRSLIHFEDEKLTMSELSVWYNDKKYKAELPQDYNLQKISDYGLCLLKIEAKPADKKLEDKDSGKGGVDCFEMLPTNLSLKGALKIYYAGYPLTQSKPTFTFHEGRIASIYEEQNVQYFNIGATIDRGYSGGPVIVQSENKLYLAGVIASADSSELQQTKELIQGLKGKIGVTSNRFSMSPSKSSEQTVNSISEVLNKMLEVIDKKSTLGTDRAIQIQHINDLASKIYVPLTGSPQPRSKDNIPTKISNDKIPLK